jgi:hypothetical protein
MNVVRQHKAKERKEQEQEQEQGQARHRKDIPYPHLHVDSWFCLLRHEVMCLAFMNVPM